MTEHTDGNEHWGLVYPFWIDTDGYTDRDREMFVAGFEFAAIIAAIEIGVAFSRPIHRENESRIRLLCARLGVSCEIKQHKGYEGCETWSDLTVER